MTRRENLKGWLTFAVVLLAAGLAGPSRAGDVVCMPIIVPPIPTTDEASQEVPAAYSFAIALSQ